MHPVRRCPDEGCNSAHEKHVHHVSECGRLRAKCPSGVCEEGKGDCNTKGCEVGDRLTLIVLDAYGKHDPMNKCIQNSNRYVAGK